jgi:hypothetical protein
LQESGGGIIAAVFVHGPRAEAAELGGDPIHVVVLAIIVVVVQIGFVIVCGDR